MKLNELSATKVVRSDDLCIVIGAHGMPRGYLKILRGRAQRQSLAVSDVYGGMYLYVFRFDNLVVDDIQ